MLFSDVGIDDREGTLPVQADSAVKVARFDISYVRVCGAKYAFMLVFCSLFRLNQQQCSVEQVRPGRSGLVSVVALPCTLLLLIAVQCTTTTVVGKPSKRYRRRHPSNATQTMHNPEESTLVLRQLWLFCS